MDTCPHDTYTFLKKFMIQYVIVERTILWFYWLKAQQAYINKIIEVVYK